MINEEYDGEKKVKDNEGRKGKERKNKEVTEREERRNVFLM